MSTPLIYKKMIIKFKKYEEYKFKYEDVKETVLSSITNYLETIIPIRKEDGFKECLYEDGNSFGVEYGKDMDFSDIILHFYFSIETNEDIFEKLEEFTKREGLKYYGEKYVDNFIEISYIISEKKIKEYYQLATNINKYNI